MSLIRIHGKAVTQAPEKEIPQYIVIGIQGDEIILPLFKATTYIPNNNINTVFIENDIRNIILFPKYRTDNITVRHPMNCRTPE